MKRVIKKVRNKFHFKFLFNKKSKTEYAHSFITGVICFPIQVGLLMLFTEVFGIFYALSAVISVIFSSGANFLINKEWTFHQNLKTDFINEISKFYSIKFISFFLTMGLLISFTEFLGIYYVFSQILSTVIVGFYNFFMNKLFIFHDSWE